MDAISAHQRHKTSWANVHLYFNPDEMWREWREFFLSSVNKHAPLKLKRVRKKRCPWITGDLLCVTRRRDFLKKAISSNDSVTWNQYKRARNRANNAINLGKKLFVSDNPEANKGNLCKTMNLINELTWARRPISWKSKLVIK